MKLESWNPDTKTWPKNRNLNLFREWFEVEIHSEVWDSLDEEIQREIL